MIAKHFLNNNSNNFLSITTVYVVESCYALPLKEQSLALCPLANVGLISHLTFENGIQN